MALDIKELIESAVDKLKNDKALQEKFKSSPIVALEELLGVDLPDEVMEKVVAGVKAKLGLDGASGVLKGLGGLLGK